MKQCRREKRSFLHTLILGNKKETSPKKYRTLISLILLGHMQKISHFWAKTKKDPKCQLGRFCPEPFNCFKGATRDFTAINLTWYLSPFVLLRMYVQAPKASCDASDAQHWGFSCICTAQTSLKGYLAKLFHLFEQFDPLLTDRRQGFLVPVNSSLPKSLHSNLGPYKECGGESDGIVDPSNLTQ